VATLFVWLMASVRNRHLRKDLLPNAKDAKNFSADVRDHLKLKLVHSVRYSPLQKLAYFGVLFVLFPLIILTGLCMSPGMNAVLPWLPELFGGRQTARTIHFITMALLVGFFVVHMAMIVLAGPLNEIRSIITGRYRLTKKDAKNV
jgi:thiosulfate reductase cytochrome b subunit